LLLLLLLGRTAVYMFGIYHLHTLHNTKIFRGVTMLLFTVSPRKCIDIDSNIFQRAVIMQCFKVLQ
jgi:hypothetical protein